MTAPAKGQSVEDAMGAWPALDLRDATLPPELAFQRGVWGKVPDAATDYRWIAASGNFLPQHADLERELNVGSEDDPRRAFYWRVVGDHAFAVTSYASRARDGAGRKGFIEKQVLAWRPSGLPAALGALCLLPRVADWSDSVWWEEGTSPSFKSDDFVLSLPAEDHSPVKLTPDAVREAIEQGIDELAACLERQELARILASLLAGGRAVPLPPLAEPLPPAALAALLLPLPRSLSDWLSLAGWTPSRHFDTADLGSRWDLVASAGKKWTPQPEPDEAQRERATRMADALFDRQPELLAEKKKAPAVATAGSDPGEEPPIQIALWGPSAAGKTALIAQLYLYREEPQAGLEWDIFPDESSLTFIKGMRSQMHRNNNFPTATVVGSQERIIYNFQNVRTGARARMDVEDRAGRDFELDTFHEEAKERLRSAQGLVLLFDPIREPTQLELEIAQTLEEVYVSREGYEKDPRPIAVCVSKADVLIETPEDYEWVLRDGEGFVREKVHDVLVKKVEHLCAHYKLFPVSSAGLKLAHGVIEPTVFYDETLTPRISRGSKPLNLMAPFAWVLDEVTR